MKIVVGEVLIAAMNILRNAFWIVHKKFSHLLFFRTCWKETPNVFWRFCFYLLPCLFSGPCLTSKDRDGLCKLSILTAIGCAFTFH